ncbi:MAG: tetratricopeptide repeat protein [Promethearchaeota archaeon]
MSAQKKSKAQPGKDKSVNRLIEKYQEILRTDPKNLKILSNLGAYYASLHKFDKAKEIFNKILENDPKNLDGLNNIGVIYTQIGKLNNAIAKLEIAVKLKPDNPKYWNNLSEVYRRAGNYHKANVCRMRAIQITEKIEK